MKGLEKTLSWLGMTKTPKGYTLEGVFENVKRSQLESVAQEHVKALFIKAFLKARATHLKSDMVKRVITQNLFAYFDRQEGCPSTLRVACPDYVIEPWEGYLFDGVAYLSFPHGTKAIERGNHLGDWRYTDNFLLELRVDFGAVENANLADLILLYAYNKKVLEKEYFKPEPEEETSTRIPDYMGYPS